MAGPDCVIRPTARPGQPPHTQDAPRAPWLAATPIQYPRRSSASARRFQLQSEPGESQRTSLTHTLIPPLRYFSQCLSPAGASEEQAANASGRARPSPLTGPRVAKPPALGFKYVDAKAWRGGAYERWSWGVPTLPHAVSSCQAASAAGCDGPRFATRRPRARQRWLASWAGRAYHHLPKRVVHSLLSFKSSGRWAGHCLICEECGQRGYSGCDVRGSA